MPDEIVRWTLSVSDSSVVCTEQQSSPDYIDVHVRYGSLPLASRRCTSRDDASRWADRVRVAWEESGWRP